MKMLFIFVFYALSCRPQEAKPPSHTKSAPPSAPLDNEAIAGVDSAELQSLFRDHWDESMKASPLWATERGDHRFNDKIAEQSPEAISHWRRLTQEFLDRTHSIYKTSLSQRDSITLNLFIQEQRSSLKLDACLSHLWNVSALDNVLTDINRIPDVHPLKSENDLRHLVARYDAIPQAIQERTDNLTMGHAQGLVGNKESLKRLITMLRTELETPVEKRALIVALSKRLSESKVTKSRQSDLLNGLKVKVSGPIQRSLSRHLTLLENQLFPNARSGAEVGLRGLSLGQECYAAKIYNRLGDEYAPEEIHKIGLDEIERINQEMQTLGQTLFKTSNLSTIIKTLRTDSSLYFSSDTEITDSATSALVKAKQAIPNFFGILPKADCNVVEIPAFQAPFTTIAYYRGPQAGNKPGEYFINTYKPETRPRFEMEVLAFHESIPGHHLQIAISQELGELPAFRKYGGNTAFVEGWALYTERLANEMNLYSGDLDRMGMLSYDAWRAARLVVDTGIHALRWTRKQAETFMLEHTALTANNISNEVDRYISWPGQALAYKMGQREIFRLRALAKQTLGESFDIKEFHDVVLGQGGVTLPILRGQIELWLAEKTGSPLI